MECNYTTYDRIIHGIKSKSLEQDDITNAIRIIKEQTLQDLVDFCLEKGIISESQGDTIIGFILMWEDLDGNYYEEDETKLVQFYEALGIEESMVREE